MIKSSRRTNIMLNKGFTLVELTMVMAVLAILATIGISSFPNAQRKARDSQRISDLKQFQTALERFAYSNNNFYPSYKGGVSPYGPYLCEDLFPNENPPCPGGPDPRDGQNDCSGETCRYRYESNGDDGGGLTATEYVLSSPLEYPPDDATPWFVLCSNGATGYTIWGKLEDTQGVCPI